MFGDAIDYSQVRLVKRKWWPFHPRNAAMAPMGHIYFHPGGGVWSEDFSKEPLGRQGFFIHEMTHVWQTQTKGDWYLILHRHPWARYKYTLKPGRQLEDYGIEQQAEIVRHAFLLRSGVKVAGAAPLEQYLALMPRIFAGGLRAA